jgi:hypothetical protein
MIRPGVTRGLTPALIVLLLTGVAGSAGATEGSAPTITLEASRRTLPYGQTVTLSGTVTPAPAPGTSVQIVPDAGPAMEAPVAGSAFSLEYQPERTVVLRAVLEDGQSEPLRIRVRAVVRANLQRVFLFGKALVTGRVLPAHPGERVEVILRRGKQVAARRWARQDQDGRFRVRIPVRRPGTYRALARFGDEDHLPGKHLTRPRTTPLPRLSRGAQGIHVRLLERRLLRLGYHLTGIDRSFDHRTGDAVVAFHKVQRMPRTKVVTEATWRRLASPFRPRPRATKPAFHIEIDQTRQVIYVVREGRIAKIVHTSTGRNNYTRDGVFRVHRKIAGYSPGRLYYPSYFDGLRAVHGWPEVPTYPASKGCARVPNWTAVWLHDIMPIGTVVRVYH